MEHASQYIRRPWPPSFSLANLDRGIVEPRTLFGLSGASGLQT